MGDFSIHRKGTPTQTGSIPYANFTAYKGIWTVIIEIWQSGVADFVLIKTKEGPSLSLDFFNSYYYELKDNSNVLVYYILLPGASRQPIGSQHQGPIPRRLLL